MSLATLSGDGWLKAAHIPSCLTDLDGPEVLKLDIELRQGRVVSLAPRAAPPSAIDLAGRMVLPGWVDMHTHLGQVWNTKEPVTTATLLHWMNASRIERAVVLTRGQYIDHDDLVLSTLRTAGDTDMGIVDGRNSRSEPASLADIERQHILDTLNQTGWNKSRAAIILGIERSTLDRKIRRYDLVEGRGKG